MLLDDWVDDIVVSFETTNLPNDNLWTQLKRCRSEGTRFRLGLRSYFVADLGHVELTPRVKIARLTLKRPSADGMPKPKADSAEERITLLDRAMLHPLAGR